MHICTLIIGIKDMVEQDNLHRNLIAANAMVRIYAALACGREGNFDRRRSRGLHFPDGGLVSLSGDPREDHEERMHPPVCLPMREMVPEGSLAHSSEVVPEDLITVSVPS